MQATKVCSWTLSLLSEISTCDGLLSHDALQSIPLDHGAALTPAGEVLHQKTASFSLPLSLSLSLSLSPKRTSAQCDPGHSGSPFFLINMRSKDELAESNQHWKRAKREMKCKRTHAHKYIQSLTCTNQIDFLRKISASQPLTVHMHICKCDWRYDCILLHAASLRFSLD